jgi:hypothetical protein
MDLKGTGFEGVDSFRLAHGRNLWRGLVTTVMQLLTSQERLYSMEVVIDVVYNFFLRDTYKYLPV